MTCPRIFRTADGEVVAEGDPRAAFLLAGPADDIPAEYEAKVDEFLAGHPVEPDADEAPVEDEPVDDEADEKAAEPAPNKQARRARNK